MNLHYYTMDDLRLGRGGCLQKGWTIRQAQELEEALEHYRGIPITKRKVLGLTDGFHVLELVKNVPLFPDDPGGEDVLASGEVTAAHLGGRRRGKTSCPHLPRRLWGSATRLRADPQPIPVNEAAPAKSWRKYLWPDVPQWCLNPQWVCPPEGWPAPAPVPKGHLVLPPGAQGAGRPSRTRRLHPLGLGPGSFVMPPGRAPWAAGANIMTKCEVCK